MNDTILNKEYLMELQSENYILNILLFDTSDVENTLFLLPDNLVSYILEFDIYNMVPTAEIIYKDVGNKFFYKILNSTSCGSYINFTKVQYLQESGRIEPLDNEYKLKFIVDSIEVDSQEFDSTQYKIKLKLTDCLHFDNYLSYTSSSNGLNCTKMIKDIFSRSKLNLDIDPYAVESDQDIVYISPCNYTMNESINYILSKSISVNNSFYSIIYNHIEDEYILFSPKGLINEYNSPDPSNDLINDRNVFMLRDDTQSSTSSKSSKQEIKYLKEYNNSSNSKISESLKTIKSFKYDHIKRKWSNSIITGNNIIDSLPMPSNKSDTKPLVTPYNEYYNEILQENGLYQKNYIPKDVFEYDKVSKELYLDTSVISFLTDGWIDRKVGDLIHISTGTLSSNFNKFNGPWLIIKIQKTMSKNEFVDVIWACRIDYNDI